MIEEQILEVYKSLNLITFPTHSQMKKHFGDTKLSGKVTKSGGTKYWAEKLNLPIGGHETSFGNKYELICLEELIKLGYSGEEMISRYPYDLLINGYIKVDVKSGTPFNNYNTSKYYSFNLEKRNPTCDIFVIYCLDSNEIIYKTLIIPSLYLSDITQLSFGMNKSKYFVFEDQWIWFQRYNNFFDKVYNKCHEICK